METEPHPIYRCSADGAHLYRIDGPDRFTELQRVGARWVMHVVVASAYPEKVRLAGIVSGADGTIPSDGREFERILCTITTA